MVVLGGILAHVPQVGPRQKPLYAGDDILQVIGAGSISLIRLPDQAGRRDWVVDVEFEGKVQLTVLFPAPFQP